MDESDVRGFMNRLLREDPFDAFEVKAAELYALTRVDISGAQDGVEEKRNVVWRELKPLVTALIKCKMPRLIKIIFSLSAGEAESLHPNASALFINMVYENGGIAFTSGTSQKQFALDKSLDERWDAYVADFFSRHEIPVKIKIQ